MTSRPPEPSQSDPGRAGRAPPQAGPFDQERFARYRLEFGATWGRPVRFHEQTTSTNDLALDAVSGEAKTGIVWLAAHQSRGRGRRGNRWQSKPGESLLMSVLLRWPKAQATEGITLAAGLAVRATCEELAPDRQFLLKWPNDVLCEGRKVSGVLVEARSRTDSTLGVVVGIGLNLLSGEFDAAWGSPTSLLLLGARREELRLESVLARLLARLEDQISILLTRGVPPLAARANRHDALRGKTIRVTREAATLEGMACGLSALGRLRLEIDGKIVELDSGHVEELTT